MEDFFKGIACARQLLQDFIDKNEPHLSLKDKLAVLTLHPGVQTTTKNKLKLYGSAILSRTLNDAKSALEYIDLAVEARLDKRHDEAMAYFYTAGMYIQRYSTWHENLDETQKIGNLLELKKERSNRRYDAPEKVKAHIGKRARELRKEKGWRDSEISEKLYNELLNKPMAPINLFKPDGSQIKQGTVYAWVRKALSE